VAQPGALVALLGEAVAEAAGIGEVGQDVVVVARLADRLDRLMHGADEAVARGMEPMSLRSSVVVAGSTMSAWRASAVHQGSCTTMVSGLDQARSRRLRSWWWWNGIAAGPPDHADIRQVHVAAVVLQGAARPFQQFGDAAPRG
jgi:hypothetical protein